MHIPWGDRVGEVNLGEAANLNTDEILLRWFNHWLKDSGDFNGEPRIRYFSLGPNEWRSAEDLAAGREFRSICTVREERIRARAKDVLALTAPEADEPRDVFVYDPEVPVLAPGGPQALSGPFDQAVLEMGNNLLVYTSEPVDARNGDIRTAAASGSTRPHPLLMRTSLPRSCA